ncbi:MAG: Tryptophan synthase alpha chain [Myxococcaceae bacterium]|nr:Tryptophan synthase alpha chain [Myxococcaceae bacterium]
MRTKSDFSLSSLTILPLLAGGLLVGVTGAQGCSSDLPAPAVEATPVEAGADAGCPAGQLSCGGACTITSSDENNCGACGTKCAAGEVCSQGACGLSCVGNTTKCGSTCVDTQSSASNCGTCGTTCAAGQVCSAGACALSCGGGATKCGTACVDMNVDTANCGVCGKTCATGYVCNAGSCGLTCPTGFSKCDGADAGVADAGDAGASSAPYCAKLTTDALNCGACGKTCLAVMGETCVNNACVQACEPVALVGTNTTASATLKTRLMATGSFCPVDFIDYSTAAPTAATLAAYRAVLVYNDVDPGATIDTALGDSLATYYDAGGRVVISLFANGGYKVTGNFGTVANGYMLFDPLFVGSSNDSIGTIAEPASPLLRDVSVLTGNVWHGTQAVVNGGVVVASWGNGSPLIVRGVVKGRKRVDVNFLPFPTGSAQAQTWTGDGIALLRNALLYR